MTDRHARRLRKAELAIRALGKHGNPKRAARELGWAESTVRKYVAIYVKECKYETPEHAIYWLDRTRISA